MTRRALVFLVTLTGLATLAPLLAPYDPEEQYRDFLYAPPMRPHLIHAGRLRAPFVYPIVMAERRAQRYAQDRSHTQALPWFAASDSVPVFLLGADSYGRDLLSRLLHGARVSLGLALAASLLALVIGAAFGAVAGYLAGWRDEAMMRVADFVIVLPVIYVALLLRALMPLNASPGTLATSMIAIFALVGWPVVARGVRSIVAGERDREYVVAARSLGASTTRIVGRHLLPACAGYLAVVATLLLPAFILGEATLSYVGLGFPEHVPTWGTMLQGADDVTALTRFPWTLSPAVAIFLTVLAANLLPHSGRLHNRHDH